MEDKTTKADLAKIVSNMIDIHFHVGPEVIPRKFTTEELCQAEAGKIGGCVLKNHFYGTSAFLRPQTSDAFLLYGSVVLNNFVGGLNPSAIYAYSLVAPKPLFVWFPTVHTKQFLDNSRFEIPPEWVGTKTFNPRLSSTVLPVVVSQSGHLVPEVFPVLDEITAAKAVLCTGHVSWQESELLAKEAIKRGIEKVIVTHPIYQRIDMPLGVQKKLADMGCYMEHCYSMHTIDKIPLDKIASQIMAVGPDRVVVSSDVGQKFSPAPSEALTNFADGLLKHGLSMEDVDRAFRVNSRRIVSLPDASLK